MRSNIMKGLRLQLAQEYIPSQHLRFLKCLGKFCRPNFVNLYFVSRYNATATYFRNKPYNSVPTIFLVIETVTERLSFGVLAFPKGLVKTNTVMSSRSFHARSHPFETAKGSASNYG